MTRKLVTEDYKVIALFLEKGKEPDLTSYDSRLYEFWDCDAFPKQRPRKGKNGVFTPPETRQYESRIKKWGVDAGMVPVYYPIGIRLDIRDYTEDTKLQALSALRVTYSLHGDLDNYAKAILDGLNGVLVKDDRQIVQLEVRRFYSALRGFSLRVWRAGLSDNELKQLMKFL